MAQEPAQTKRKIGGKAILLLVIVAAGVATAIGVSIGLAGQGTPRDDSVVPPAYVSNPSGEQLITRTPEAPLLDGLSVVSISSSKEGSTGAVSSTYTMSIRYWIVTPGDTGDRYLNIFTSTSLMSDTIGVIPKKTVLAGAPHQINTVNVDVHFNNNVMTELYFYTTIVIDNVESLLSLPLTYTFNVPPQELAGSNLAITSNMGEIDLTWTDVPDAYYNVYRATQAFTAETRSTLANILTTTTALSFHDSIAVNGLYYYAVVSIRKSDGGESGMSSVEMVTVDIPYEGDTPMPVVFIRVDETSANMPYSMSQYNGKAEDAPALIFSESPQTSGNMLFKFKIGEEDLKTWIGVQSLYASDGNPCIFYGKHWAAWAQQIMWIIKVGDSWYVAPYGCSTLDGVAYSLNWIQSHPGTWSGGASLYLPAPPEQTRSFLVGIGYGTMPGLIGLLLGLLENLQLLVVALFCFMVLI